MRIFNHIDEIKNDTQGAAYAIGNFDGVHLGHQKVIKAMTQSALARSLKAAVLTFEPPPSAFFHPQKPANRLCLPQTKAAFMERLGVDFILNLPFDESLAHMTARDFIDKILKERLRAQHITIGASFRFGAKRQGDGQMLKADFAKKINIVTAFKKDEVAISSTLIRQALASGQVATASHYLGHYWQIIGMVIEGEKRGRKIGFPTLNIELDDYTPCAYGVYAALCQIKGKTFSSIVNIGVRPTFGAQEKPLLEAHLFNIKDDFYNETAQIFLLDFIRKEKQFSSVEDLKKQIARDCQKAREICQSCLGKTYPPFWSLYNDDDITMTETIKPIPKKPIKD